jgi:hypothetical protein
MPEGSNHRRAPQETRAADKDDVKGEDGLGTGFTSMRHVLGGIRFHDADAC